jgi:hypothetical protein
LEGLLFIERDRIFNGDKNSTTIKNMKLKELSENRQANESVSKYKLLSAYGGPGSIVHTQYGSIIISCIEEWGFLKKVMEIHKEANDDIENNTDIKVFEYVKKQCRLERNGRIGISNDRRLLDSLKSRKDLINLKYLTLIPDIEINVLDNKVKEGVELTIPSSFMPKVFADRYSLYKNYAEWFKDWTKNPENNDTFGNKFFPPRKSWKRQDILTQDNVVLICEHGHISDFPWSQFLRMKKHSYSDLYGDSPINLFDSQPCCGSIDNPTSKITISANYGNASGFDGKWLKCNNCGQGTSLKGLMSTKIECPGHKPWEVRTEGNGQFPYSGNATVRRQSPPYESCLCIRPMKVALTTGNNLYYSRVLTSIFMPEELFDDDDKLELKALEINLEEVMTVRDFKTALEIQKKIEVLKLKIDNSEEQIEIPDSTREIQYRFQEFKALKSKSDDEISQLEKHLKVRDVTKNLIYKDYDLTQYFSRILRIDNMKITSAQLDFSRVIPADADAELNISKNIFRNRPSEVELYPVVENYGEGIFFAFSDELIDSFGKNSKDLIIELNEKLEEHYRSRNDFNNGAITYGLEMNWQLYLVHTFTHLIMRELEFRCGYPTASLSERIYVSNDDVYKMYGCMIYTTEGGEGSMGGVIAQTRPNNLNNLICSALKRATICNSDPLCWESEGQGLFELNFSSCFSCSLVSETSCEHRNIYLDRRILVDENNGFFKKMI